LYEETRDRPNQELANGVVVGFTPGAVGTDGALDAVAADTPLLDAAGVDIAVLFKESTTAIAGSDEAAFQSGKWGKDGENFVDGYTYLYYGPKSTDGNYKTNAADLEQNLIAIQDKGSGQFLAAPGFKVTITKSAQVRDKFLVQPPKIGPGNNANWLKPVGTKGEDLSAVLAAKGVFGIKIELDQEDPAASEAKINAAIDAKYPGKTLTDMRIYAFGRYNSESDFKGNYLGEVELRMDEYTFKPSPTTIGVSWSQLTEITLDTSFNISAEETLVTYASQAIRSALDYRAMRLAYAIAKTNVNRNKGYYYEFDAAWDGGASVTLEGYIANAQTFVSAIDAIGDTMYDEINRGGVSRLVGGPAACSYMHLNSGYTTKGLQNQTGSYQFGELDGMPIFKVPSAVIPTDEILTVWKNDAKLYGVNKAA
jgi:hypothetical protein